MVILLKYPGATEPVASDTLIALPVVFIPFITIQFFTVTSVIGVVPIELIMITLGDVALVLVMVKSFTVPVAFTLPSMVTLFDPANLIMGPEAILPVMTMPVMVG